MGRCASSDGGCEAYVEVLGVNVTVLGEVEVLLGHEHTLCLSISIC